MGVIIYITLDSVVKFSEKSIVYLYIWSKWMIRIWQNDADPDPQHREKAKNILITKIFCAW